MPARISHDVVERRLLDAPRTPEVLHRVVGLLWFSLLHGTRDPPAGEVAASRTDAEDEAAATSPAPPPPPLTAPWIVRASHVMGDDGDASLAASGVDVDEWGSAAFGGFCAEGDEAAPSTLTAATSSVFSGPLPSTRSAPDSSSFARHVAQPVPVVELSPLILRVLLWWAGHPRLPPRRRRRSERPTTPESGESASGGRGAASPASCGDGGTAAERAEAARQRRVDAVDAQQLRRRIAEIFAVLCHRGDGVVVSDALLYGQCHDSSERAAQRCRLVFSSCSDARWHAATSRPASASPSPPLSLLSSSSLHTHHDPAVAHSRAYSAEELLCRLVDVHTSAAAAAPHASSLRGASSSADVVAAGLLLRTLLSCPRVHTRLVHLFSAGSCGRAGGDSEETQTPRQRRRGRSTAAGAGQPSVPDAVAAEAAATRRDIAVFLPVLTHASPTVSTAAWQTLGSLLLRAGSAPVGAAVHRLLSLAPPYPVQRLLAAALALPGDDDEGGSGEGGQGDRDGDGYSSAVQGSGPPPSHPEARNCGLRLLHVLCTSTSVPPTAQTLFHQCPALLWRVLRLAEALCNGVPVAHGALVRGVLADYVMCAARSSHSGALSRSSDGVAPLSTSAVSVSVLLRLNKDALLSFLSATCATWGDGGCGGGGGGVDAAMEDDGGDRAGSGALTAAACAYGEENLMRSLRSM
ncbi:hypothetical protein NESM_000336000 [Novymonas esmeraldas]|uniref:Uncharacterized protein n=1 Tax=Novymonas esmeraldas TaxID=1808958 RepID=A0AAW0EM43_9TRYP